MVRVSSSVLETLLFALEIVKEGYTNPAKC